MVAVKRKRWDVLLSAMVRSLSGFYRFSPIGRAGVAAFVLITSSYAADQNLEQNDMADLASSLAAGKVVSLGATGISALQQQARREPTHGAVVLMPGPTEWVNGSELIKTLFLGLPDRGWDVIWLPPPIKEGKPALVDYLDLLSEGAERVGSGVKLNLERKVQRIVLIGQSIGALMALRYLANTPVRNVHGLILIDLPNLGAYEPQLLDELAKAQLPLLEIAREQGRGANFKDMFVHREATKRNRLYRQMLIQDAPPGDFSAHGYLLNHVSGWLARLP
jgi:pimeloyl-ACP methyl ester carboxylesterase